MIITRTPFRISFFGGGTDYPAWYRQHGGAVLASAINKYCYLTCRYLPPFFDHRIRVVYSKIESCQSVDEIQHPAVRETLRFLRLDRGIEIHHDGDLPARSGIGSSSAFTVGLLHALYALKGYMPSRRQLATESIHLEQEILRETVGSQDQVLAAYGGFNHVTFLQNGEFSVRPIVIEPSRLKELNSNLILLYTGIQRTASAVAQSYANNLEARKRQLRLLKDLVEEGVAILSSARDLSEFGELLHESWQAKRSLSTEVSNPEVEEIYEQARSAGAIGGKLTGAGGGGFLLLYVPIEHQNRVISKLKQLIHVPFNFEFHGSQVIFLETEEDFSMAEETRAHQVIQSFREKS
jgi:D-glycero-alpha-D-manno-heptose-7-phosphate kinase